MGYLNNDGLLYLWNKITSKFVAKEEGKGLSTNDYTSSEKTKLAGIEAGADNTTIINNLTSTDSASALSAAQGKVLKDDLDSILGQIGEMGGGDMMKATYDTDGDGIVDNAEKVNGLTVLTAVPAGAKFTDTTYENATGSKAGLMSAAHYTKLNNMPANPIDNIDTNSGQVEATGGLVSIVGSNGIKTAASEDTMSIIGQAASSSVMGMMTAAQYSKLEALPTNATLESTFAKKTDITGVYKYKGSVASASALPSSASVGDVYDIQIASTYGGAGMNVVWTGTEWDALGEVFTITSITNAEIDTICV